MSLLAGIALHAVGAFSASVCYTPQKKTQRWSWQSFWLAQALVCWLVLPVLVAILTIPHLMEVLAEAPAAAMWQSFLFGAFYGIGGTAFGLAIRYLGFSLTYAVSVGLSCLLGTLLPPLTNGNFADLLKAGGIEYIFGGLLIGTAGIVLCGLAGHSKEKDLQAERNDTSPAFMKGLLLALLAGCLSALYGYAIEKGQPIAAVAANYGAGAFQTNIIYLFSNTGAFCTTAIYCIYLHRRHKTIGEYMRPAITNYLLAALTGLLWFGQFFFYGMGHLKMHPYQFVSWAVHMILLVLFSVFIGIAAKEWKHSSNTTRRYLKLAIISLIFAVLLLTYGNFISQ